MLAQWFDDINSIIFLYNKSKKYNPENYFNSEPLKTLWKQYLANIDMLIEDDFERKEILFANKLNPYWIEYHFLYSIILKKVEEESNLISDIQIGYINNLKNISFRFKEDPTHTLFSNGVLWNIYDRYEKKGDYAKANEIAELNNFYPDVWREIPLIEEEVLNVSVT